MCVEWISIEDRLPRNGEQIMVVFDQGFIRPHYMYWDEEWHQEGISVDGDQDNSIVSTTVTHWMPFPAPPVGAETPKSIFMGHHINLGDDE